MSNGGCTGEKTRQQRMLELAAKNVASVDQKLGKSYKSVAQSFPVIVRTCGLCQALAFSKAKSSSRDLGPTYQLINKHVRSILSQAGLINDGQDLVDRVASMDAREYTLATRVLLSGWVYHKRFAEARFR